MRGGRDADAAVACEKSCSPERITKLHTLGWTLDSSFGNYVQIFPSGSPVKDIAERLLQALKDGYEANISDLEVGSDWIKSERCPPRNGPSQNLAGMISDALSMTGFRVHALLLQAERRAASSGAQQGRPASSVHGTRVAGEIQRLRVEYRPPEVHLGRGRHGWRVHSVWHGAPARDLLRSAISGDMAGACAKS